MIFREFHGKELFKEAGIPTASCALAKSASEAGTAAERIGFPVVIKAHVAAGGRGKAGFVRVANSKDEAEQFAGDMLGRVHKSFLIDEVLVERALDIAAELYMSVALNNSTGRAMLMYSPEGGMDIEQIAVQTPEKLLKYEIYNLKELHEFRLRDELLKTGIKGDALNKLAGVAYKLCRMFSERDLILAEINPLVVLSDGQLFAADAKVEMDNNALRRQGVSRDDSVVGETPEEVRGREIGITLIKLDGDIGIVASGAGLAMNTMDILKDRGLKAANFLETGGGITAALIEGSILLLLEDPKIRGVVINLYGGVNSMLEAAKGIVAADEKNVRRVPFVVKILGNQQEEAWELVESRNIPMIKTPHTEEAVARLVQILEEAR